MPAETLGKGFEVPMCFRMDCALAPLREVVPMAFFFADDVEVLRLAAHCVLNDKMILRFAIPSTVVIATTQESCTGL